MSSPFLRICPPLPLGVYTQKPRERLPFPLEEETSTIFANARHGLWRGVGALGLEHGDEILVPAYHHGAEIEALIRAGLTCRFYEATDTLAPDANELEQLVGSRTRALYLIHYLGVPQDPERWRGWCDARGLLLIEGAAQSWLASFAGRPVGSTADLALFCLYKTFGLPDGAAVVARERLASPEGKQRYGLRAVAGRHAHHGCNSTSDFALGDVGARPARLTLGLLARIDGPEIAARRRANYHLLLDGLRDLVPTPFRDPDDGASPFAFPIETKNKPALLERLRTRGIGAVDLWSQPHPELPSERFPGAERRRRTTVLLPVHQGLRVNDLERIAHTVLGRTPPRNRLRLTLIEDPEALAGPELAEEWRALAAESRNIFATHEWLTTWWRHFGRGRRLLLFACRGRDDRLVALLPLYVAAQSPLGVVRFLGHGPGDQLGPVCAPYERVAAARALRQSLQDCSADWDVFVGDELPGDEGWSALLDAKTVARQGNPVLRFRGESWDQVLAARGSNLRKSVRYAERRLARDHGLSYRMADETTLERDLDALFALHGERWSSDSPFLRRQAFHRDFASQALERGWLRLWLLEADGETAAAWLGFRFQGVESYYQAGRDPNWQQRSVGAVLVAHSIRAALEDGADEYRFLRGDEPFKSRYANADPGLETVVLSRGLLAGAATAFRPVATRLL